MAMANRPFEMAELDITDESSAKRIGKRIRAIRTARGISQTELGTMVGLNADRIQKYENGARKPKEELLNKIAVALGVSPLAIADPNASGQINAMFAMFELEDIFGMVVEKHDNRMSLSIDNNDSLATYMNEWHKMYLYTMQQMEVAISEEERDEIVEAYHNWKWTFPQGIVDKGGKEEMKKQLKNKIEELQKAYNKLDSDEE